MEMRVRGELFRSIQACPWRLFCTKRGSMIGSPKIEPVSIAFAGSQDDAVTLVTRCDAQKVRLRSETCIGGSRSCEKDRRKGEVFTIFADLGPARHRAGECCRTGVDRPQDPVHHRQAHRIESLGFALFHPRRSDLVSTESLSGRPSEDSCRMERGAGRESGGE